MTGVAEERETETPTKLTRPRVLQAAVEPTDDIGTESLTIGKQADRLGVGTKTITAGSREPRETFTRLKRWHGGRNT